jgi:hypothetical protein
MTPRQALLRKAKVPVREVQEPPMGVSSGMRGLCRMAEGEIWASITRLIRPD